jgi:hypothetical protein
VGIVAYDVEREPGSFAKRREALELRMAALFGCLVGAAVFVSLALIVAGASGVVAALLLVAVAYVAKDFASEHLNAAVKWGKGGNGEAKVGGVLEGLRREGYFVMHDLEEGVPGNVDHLVSGPTGTFLVETKFRRYDSDGDLARARRVAYLVATQLRTPWVQPVICFATRSYGPRETKGVVLVGVDQLVPFIRSQRNATVSFEALTAFADQQ